jgi:hypothetical protein
MYQHSIFLPLLLLLRGLHLVAMIVYHAIIMENLHFMQDKLSFFNLLLEHLQTSSGHVHEMNSRTPKMP